MGRLRNQIAIITGAGNGIGKSIAKLFAQEAAIVVVSDIELKSIQEVAADISANGGTAIAVVADVTDEKAVQQLFETTIQSFKKVDILVNCAGILDDFLPAEKTTDTVWNRVFAVNVTGSLRTIRKALPYFIEYRKGNIINIASIGGTHGSRAGAAYTASKHALVGLSKNVAFQYATYGIRCNAIAPGAIHSHIGETLSHPDELGITRASAGIALNPEVGEAMDIANIALFLACQESKIINGTVITADSGWTAY